MSRRKTIIWEGYEWQIGERWGIIHPEKPICYYDKDAVKISEDGELELYTHYNPRKFKDKTVNTGVGLINCKEKFEYGRFDIDIKLPKGPLLWPAFWMWSYESWPPEIDVFEGYSNKKGSYFNWNIDALWGNFWNVKSNLHLGVQPDNYQYGAKRHWLGWKCPSEDFHKYSVEWFPNEVNILFDDRLVRTIKDEKTLMQLRDMPMNIIINTHVRPGYPSDDKELVTKMVCKNFRYSKFYPYNL